MLAKSILNSIERLMPQTLIDLDISHEELKTIVNEKEKYDQVKESIRNKKNGDEFSENKWAYKKNIFLLFCVIYKNSCYCCSSL